MEDNKMFTEENEEPMLITLTDEETGEDTEFEVIADEEVGGKRYVYEMPINKISEYFI